MLFNSFEFIFFFFPLTLFFFFRITKLWGSEAAISWLIAASLFFYGWWNPAYLILIVSSVIFNFIVGSWLSKRPAKWILWIGLLGNLGLLAYFKYAGFLVDNVSLLVGAEFSLGSIALPLAISFFTFQQIAYLVDVFRGETKEYSFKHYTLFVLFFPQLIAGPIVHHREILPQFTGKNLGFKDRDFAIGLTIFIIGLFKKVVIADNLAVYATPVFSAAEAGAELAFLEAWGGALAYTFQLYFDFSGYSDMAIGIARTFGIQLPVNFFSPYKAHNIIEFWRRWHMTLSRFLRDYLYFSLGGNRKGQMRRYLNLFITMLLGGLWHGAGWTFVAWGALHGFYLVVNYAWRYVCQLCLPKRASSSLGRFFSVLVTFVVVVIGWVFFRAESFPAALSVLVGMFGGNGLTFDASFAAYLPESVGFIHYSDASLGSFDSADGYALIILSAFIVWMLPSTQEFTELQVIDFDRTRVSSRKLVWRANTLWAMVILFMAVTVIANLHRVSEFLYFNF